MGSSKRAKVWRRTRVGGSIAAAVAALVWVSAQPGGEVFVLAVGTLLGLLSVYECCAIGVLGRGVGVVCAALAVLGTAGLLYNPVAFDPPQLAAFAFAAVCAGFTRLGPGPRVERPSWLLPSGLALLLAISMPGLYALRLGWGIDGLIVLLVLAKSGDIAGYYVGNAMGKTHPFPKISPGKTTAGCVGSLIAGGLIGVAFQTAGMFPGARLGLFSGLLAGLLVNVAAQAGDLFESWVKRRVGVKDSGTWFGPSGGVLDLIDSFLFAVPVALLSWPLLFNQVP